MEIFGLCIKYIRRNEKTGESTLLVRTKEKDYFCQGIMPFYPVYTPLKITGTTCSDNSFSAESVNFYPLYKEGMKKFLCGDYFSGIGEVTAEKLSEAIIKSPEIIKKYSEKLSVELNTDIIKNALKKIYNLTIFEDLYSYISNFGGRYYIAYGAFNKYREEALACIKKYPYTLLMFDAPFNICEKIAKENNIEGCQKERIHAIVKDMLIRNQNNGNTQMTFAKLCESIHQAENKANCGYYTNPLFIAEELLQTDYVIEYGENEVYLYLAIDYQAEKQIADSIKRLSQAAVPLENSILSIDELEKQFSISYSNEQKGCFEAIENSGIKIITGGPGTGKTTLLNGLLTKYRANHPDKVITLCAPTGCAAKRMRETTGMSATTIHKLLQIKPFEKKDVFRIQKINADCLIVDESSMIDTFLMAQLLSSVKNDALVIFIGDKDQLPSVGAGDVFRDLIESNIIEVYQLHTIFRQMEENAIIYNSKNIIQGIAELKESPQFKIKRFSSGEEMAKEAADIAHKCFKHGIENIKIYTPVRKIKFHCSTVNINRQIQQEKRNLQNGDMSSLSHLEYGFYRFYVGDGIIFTRNNYEKGYYNGQEGIITCIQRHTDTTRIAIETDDGSITISGIDINDIELNYAITAHKSQGAECDNAVIIIPKKPKAMLQRKILYVEITRAKKGVIILSEKDALEQAISSYMEIPRTTGLKRKLQELSKIPERNTKC